VFAHGQKADIWAASQSGMALTASRLARGQTA
jgi:hypothetical protein